MPATLSEPERDQAASLVAMFTMMVHAWLTNDFTEAARTRDELERLPTRVDHWLCFANYLQLLGTMIESTTDVGDPGNPSGVTDFPSVPNSPFPVESNTKRRITDEYSGIR